MVREQTRSKARFVHVQEQTMVCAHTKQTEQTMVRSCTEQTEQAIEIYALAIAFACTNVPLSPERTWTLFHHPQIIHMK